MHDLTKGPIIKTLVVFTLPMVLGNVLQTLYSLVDTAFVGRLGANAVAAVSVSFTLIFVLVALAMGFTMGTTTLVAQYFGAGEMKRVKAVVTNSMVFTFWVAAVLSVVGIVCRYQMLDLIDTPANIRQDAARYMVTTLVGMPFMFSYFLIAAVLRGVGDSKTPLRFMVISTVINIVLDPLLIFGWGPIPRLEVVGAGLATLLAQLVATYIGFRYMMSPDSPVQLSFSGFRFDWQVIGAILRLGIPAGISQVVVALGGTVIVSLINSFGEVAAAIYGIGSKVDAIAMMPAMSLSMAVAAMVGQSLGAGLQERALEVVTKGAGLIFGVLLAFGGLGLLFPAAFIAIFTNDPALIVQGTSYMYLVAWSYGFLGLSIVLGGALRGAGAMLASMLLSIIFLWLVRIPLAYGLVRWTQLGADSIWLSLSLTNLLGALISVLYVWRGRWLERGQLVTESKEA